MYKTRAYKRKFTIAELCAIWHFPRIQGYSRSFEFSLGETDFLVSALI